ncbi:hypothetical protein EKO27_g7452 [Xylaria grammica]|uniref:Mediator complex subunit 15 KIX domain-containing protein n=1 Tax=Xylaria grammica TaxID=363999 RepID=A0A439D066_9PEZI|nr:hypothetical protein EKO27_g7452 [Xylaria grammica]
MQQQISNTGWQSSVPPSMRVGHAMNVITNSFLAMPQADSAQILGVGLTYERDAFTSSPDKITYEQRILTRVNELFKKRQANEQNIHHSLTAQAQNQAQMMLNQNMQMRGMGQPMQQSFQNLQQQSPINQQGQPGIGINNPNNLPMNPNQQPMQLGAQMRPQMTMQPGASTLPAQDRVKINQLAIGKFNSIPEPNRSQYRAAVQQKFGPQVMAQLQQENIDPLLYFFQSQVQSQIMQSASKAQAGVNQPGMPMQAHQQRSMNQPTQQLPTGPNGEFGPFANVESIMNQQKAGLMAQEAGQMVVPASNGAGRNVTPQPVGSMPGSNQGAGQPTLQHQLPQQFNHQPAQQLKMDQRAAQTQAQIRAQAQAKQMQGQPGGLNGPGGASQSPGMNTLNAPVRRAPMGVGQTEGHPPIGQGNVPFGQHMMDPRFSQSGQRTPMGPNGNMNRHQVLHNILAQMPAETRQQIMNLPQDKVPEMIMRWNASRGVMPGRPQPQMSQLTPGNPMAQSLTQFAPGNNQLAQHPNLNMPMNQQNQMIMQQQMNKLRNPNGPQGPLDRTALMDNMAVPLRVLEQLRLVSQPGGVSPEIKKWGQLKQLLAQKNPSQQTVQGLLNVQNAQFQSYLKTNPGLVAAGSQPQPNNLSQQGIHPNGQPTPQMGQSTPNMAGSSPNITISSHELQNARSHEKFKSWSDEKIRQMLTQVKLQALKNRAGPPAQIPQVSQPGQQATVPAVQSTSGASMPPQRPPNVSAETNTASPVVQGRNTKQPPNNHAAAGATTAPTAKTGTKRPIPDDIAEGPNPSRTPIQRPHSQQPHATTQIPHFSPEQLATMTPEQRQKYEAVMKSRQPAPAGQIPEDMMRLKAIGQEQFQMAIKEQLPDVPMTPEQYQDTAQKVQAMCGEMNKISKIVGRWYSATHDDARAAMFFKLRMRLFRQYVDGEKMSVLKDRFSITPTDLDSISGMLQSFAKDISTYFPSMRKNPSQQSAPEPAAPQGGSTRPGVPTTQPTPLSAANLEKQTQALIKMQARTNVKVGQPPAAPTTAQPPFPFGAQSPDGRPTYAGGPAVTQESLQLPARKRPKTESKAGAGSNQNGSNANASPHVQKMSSPELNKRQAVAEARQAPKFTCSDQYCEFRSIGFPTEETLRKHTDEEHKKPAEDPVKFAADSLAEVLGLDANGKVKKTPTTGGNIQSPVDISKHIQTPTTRAEAPMQRQGSATGSKSNELVKTIAGKASTPKLDSGSKTLDSSTPAATANSGTSLQVAGGESIGTTIDPQELLSGVTGLEMGGDGAILDMNVYRSITPNDTPESSKDSASSEPNSDVSEGVALNMTLDMGFGTWDPFALGHDGPNLDLGNVDMPGLPYTGFSWDEVNPDFDKPFALDTSLFSLDAS